MAHVFKPVYYAEMRAVDWEMAPRLQFLAVFVHISKPPYIRGNLGSYCRKLASSPNFFKFFDINC